MKISFDNNFYNNYNQLQKPNFNGKGVAWINNFQKNERSLRFQWYNDMLDDLAEGAKLYFKAHKDIDRAVQKFHHDGGLTAWFELPDDKILKISLENPLEFRPHNPDFDIPFLTPVEQYAKTYIVTQPKADTENITDEDILDMRKRIWEGYCEQSNDGCEYGKYNGKTYLIDTRSVMPMPNPWTVIIDAIYQTYNKCTVDGSGEQARKDVEKKYLEKGYHAYHTDETPRPSLTFAGGLLKIFTMVKNNIKYRKNCYSIPYEVSRAQWQRIMKHTIAK